MPFDEHVSIGPAPAPPLPPPAPPAPPAPAAPVVLWPEDGLVPQAHARTSSAEPRRCGCQAYGPEAGAREIALMSSSDVARGARRRPTRSAAPDGGLRGEVVPDAALLVDPQRGPRAAHLPERVE